MAKLSANGTEAANLLIRRPTPDGPLEKKFSVRSNGIVLVNSRWAPGKWTGWKRAYRYEGDPQRIARKLQNTWQAAGFTTVCLKVQL